MGTQRNAADPRGHQGSPTEPPVEPCGRADRADHCRVWWSWVESRGAPANLSAV